MAGVGFQMPPPLETSSQAIHGLNDFEDNAIHSKSPSEAYLPISVPHKLPISQAVSRLGRILQLLIVNSPVHATALVHSGLYVCQCIRLAPQTK